MPKTLPAHNRQRRERPVRLGLQECRALPHQEAMIKALLVARLIPTALDDQAARARVSPLQEAEVKARTQGHSRVHLPARSVGRRARSVEFLTHRVVALETRAKEPGQQEAKERPYLYQSLNR